MPDDEPKVLAVLIQYFYNFTLDLTKRPEDWSRSAFVVQVYAIADKYDVPQLRDLCTKHFEKTCDPLSDVGDFIEAIRAVDEYTVGSVGKPLWDVVKPKMRDNVTFLLTQEGFKALFLESEFQPLFFELLGMLDPSSGQGEEDLDRASTTADGGWSGDLDHYNNPFGGFGHRGPGRRLG